jgi:ABC-type transport system involved in multi-copper enzyme maturation permease subunit
MFWKLVFERPDPPSLGFQLWYFQGEFLNGPLCWVALLVSVIVTSFFIPNMLQKGRVDLLLVKPISRVGLLVYKYLGGLLFIFLNSLFAIGGVWVVLGLRSGVWQPAVLLTVFVITFFFAILYSVSTLAAVLTRSGVVAIIATCFVWLLLFAVGRAYTFLHDNEEKARVHNPQAVEVPDWALPAATVVHHTLPRTDDMNPLITKLLAESLMPPAEVRGFDLATRAVNWGESIGVSLGFIVLFVGLSCWRFSTRDY